MYPRSLITRIALDAAVRIEFTFNGLDESVSIPPTGNSRMRSLTVVNEDGCNSLFICIHSSNLISIIHKQLNLVNQ